MAVVLITGCSSGLGKALAYEFFATRNAATGEPLYRVFASARSLGSLKALDDDGIDVLQLDVTQPESVAAAVGQVLHSAGRIDVLINNAGISRMGPLLEQPLSELREVLDTNVIGQLCISQEVGRVMRLQRSGVIVNIGSVSATFTRPFAGAYCASKAALHSLNEALRMEMAPFGVEVLLVQLGAVLSALVENSKYASGTSAYQWIANSITMSAELSQDPKSAMLAEEAAASIAAVLNRRFQPDLKGRRGARSLPARIWTGGSVLKYLLYGFLQQWVAPGLFTDRLLPKMFGLKELKTLVESQADT